MNKEEYLSRLRKELTEIAISNVEGRIEYYSEMIDDRIEDGMSEEEAVSSMESIESIVETSKLEKPMTTLVKEKVKKSKENAEKKGHGALWVILSILGFPLWFPLLVTLGCLILTLYIILWSFVIVCYSVELALGLAAVGVIILLPFSLGSISIPGIIAGVGCACILGGLTILLWKPIAALTKATIKLFAMFISGIKTKLFK